MFRDGVGDIQLSLSATYEAEQFKDACHHISLHCGPEEYQHEDLLPGGEGAGQSSTRLLCGQHSNQEGLVRLLPGVSARRALSPPPTTLSSTTPLTFLWTQFRSVELSLLLLHLNLYFPTPDIKLQDDQYVLLSRHS